MLGLGQYFCLQTDRHNEARLTPIYRHTDIMKPD